MIRPCLIAMLLAGTSGAAIAQIPGVDPLLQQGRYWQNKGRGDLAAKAFRRVLALDPSNAEAQRALSQAAPAARPRPAPAPTPARGTPAPAASQPRTAAAPTAAPAAPRDRGGEARADGFRALDENALGEAERLFQRALSISRGDTDSSGGLGLVRLRQSRFAEAATLLERASKGRNPGRWAEALNSARFYAGLDDARAKLAAGDLSGAEAEAERLARSGVGDPAPALSMLADIYERQGRYADAADMARQAGSGAGATEAQLASRVARNNALQAAQRGDTVTAEREFQRGLMADQNDPWIRYEFARYLMGRGRAPETASLIQSLQVIGSPDALYTAAMLHAQADRQEQAQQLLDRIPQANMTSAMNRFAASMRIDAAVERARALGGSGQAAVALASLRELAATPDLDAGALATIAGAMNDLGDTATASALAQQALTRGLSSVEEYEPVVRVLVQTGQDQAALSAVEQARGAAQGSADGQPAIGQLQAIYASAQADQLRLAGQYAQAFDLLQQSWGGAPGNTELLGALARLYQSGNMPSQAAQTYRMVLASEPRNKGAMIGLIGSAGANGDRELANATIEQALRVYPDDYEIYAAAGQMEQARGNRGAALRYLRKAEQSYAAKHGSNAMLTRANPFVGGGATMDTNPFRRAAAPAPAMANPFALSGGRVPTSPMAPIATPGQPVPFHVAPAFGPAGAGFAASAPGNGAGTTAAVSTDPVIAQLQRDVQRLSADSAPRAEVEMGYRERSGETGLSQLRELSATATVSTGFAGGRIAVGVTPVVIDAGRPTGSGLARFGRNGTAEAEAIVAEEPSQLAQADTQHASGVAVSASYDSRDVRLDVGTTPLGMGDTRVTFGFAAKPRLGPNATAQGFIRREAVTDSVVSYAGARDPVTGQRWGEVMRTGGGASVSWDRGGTGVYGDVSGYRYTGMNVRDNRGFQANIGGYMPVFADGSSRVTAGLNVNWQSFDNNQNYFSFGHGGYFSPQSFLSVSLPLRYAYDSDRIEARLNVTPGYQSFEQDMAPLYPTDPVAQAVLDGLKGQNSDVRSTYDSLSETGFAFRTDGSIYYRVTPSTRIGGSLNVNTFGTYDEYRSTIGIRQSLGSSGR